MLLGAIHMARLEIRKNCTLPISAADAIHLGFSVLRKRLPIHTLIRKLAYTNGVANEYPPRNGSVTAINTIGSRYACQDRRRAPAKRLRAPTGAKFRFCANRAIPPRTVRLKAKGRAELSCI